MRLKPKELLIISALRQDSRISLTEMSKKTRVPISTIYDRLKVFKHGLIKKNTAIIDFSKLGYNTRANVLLKVKREEREKLRAYLMSCKNANSVSKVNNGFDFMVEFIFKHIKDLEDYIEFLEEKFEIQNKQTFYVIDDLKREEFVMV